LFLVEMTRWPVPVAKGIGWSVSCRPVALKVVVLLRMLREHPDVPPVRAPIAAAVIRYLTGERIRGWGRHKSLSG
jgi:hypothetical protein